MTSTGYSSLLCSWESLPNDIVSIAEYLIRITTEQAFATCLFGEKEWERVGESEKRRYEEKEWFHPSTTWCFQENKINADNCDDDNELEWKFYHFPTGYTFCLCLSFASFLVHFFVAISHVMPTIASYLLRGRCSTTYFLPQLSSCSKVFWMKHLLWVTSKRLSAERTRQNTEWNNQAIETIILECTDGFAYG